MWIIFPVKIIILSPPFFGWGVVYEWLPSQQRWILLIFSPPNANSCSRRLHLKVREHNPNNEGKNKMRTLLKWWFDFIEFFLCLSCWALRMRGMFLNGFLSFRSFQFKILLSFTCLLGWGREAPLTNSSKGAWGKRFYVWFRWKCVRCAATEKREIESWRVNSHLFPSPSPLSFLL